MIAVLLLALSSCSSSPGAPDGAIETDAIEPDASEPIAVGHAAWPIPPEGSALEIDGALARDPITGLVWQRDEPGTQRTQAGAIDACEALELGGRDDFRLPTRIEWITIVEPARSPALDPVAFPAARPEYHWTSSLSRAMRSAFSVYLGGGETTLGDLLRPSALARCVAGGAVLRGDPLEILDADRARHRGTGLVWSRAHLDPAAHADAAATCAALGMRMPTVRELQSIVDETRIEPAIDTTVFPGALSLRHWTSTIRDAGELLPWTVDFRDGQTFAEDPQSTEHVARCVL